jgi:hypothetical protein
MFPSEIGDDFNYRCGVLRFIISGNISGSWPFCSVCRVVTSQLILLYNVFSDLPDFWREGYTFLLLAFRPTAVCAGSVSFCCCMRV